MKIKLRLVDLSSGDIEASFNSAVAEPELSDYTLISTFVFNNTKVILVFRKN